MDNSAIGRKVAVLRLNNQGTMITDFGNFKNPITETTKTKNDTDMIVVNEGVIATFTISRTKKKVSTLIPWGNIVSAELAE